ncbi:MAG: DUF397 domain-containing protein [Streptosporangiaceae bacterium]|jgi:hypothetical protein|nr:DUF397 domain-containing protein [Actinomycetota bacterium]
MTDLSQAAWRKARASQNNGGCVEVAANLPEVVAVRDSKRPADGAHVLSRAAFAAFLADARAGRYDLDARA